MQSMNRVTVRANQTIFDIALEQYGTIEAVAEILSLNPNIGNAPQSKKDVGIDYIADTDFYHDLALSQTATIIINPDSELRRQSIRRELQGIEITTYNNGKDNQSDTR